MNTLLSISSVLLWIVVTGNLLLTFAIIRKLNNLPEASSNQRVINMLDNGAKAPDFAIQGLDGREIRLGDFAQRDLAMVFVSSACTPCHDKMPELAALYSQAQQADVELVVCNLDDLDTTREFADDVQFNQPIFAAPRGENPLNTDYKVPGTPSYYLINKEGYINAGGFFDEQWESIVASWRTAEPSPL